MREQVLSQLHCWAGDSRLHLPDCGKLVTLWSVLAARCCPVPRAVVGAGAEAGWGECKYQLRPPFRWWWVGPVPPQAFWGAG